MLCLLILIGCQSQKQELKTGQVSIIPKPVEQVIGQGYFEIDIDTKIAVENEEQRSIVNQFLQQFEIASGWRPIVEISDHGDILFQTSDSIEKEGYSLDVTSSGVNIEASTGAGFFYAIESFKQLFPVEFYLKNTQSNSRWGIPVVNIKDKPSFGWRGYMLDVSRHFFDKNQVKEVIDFMAASKLNRFHWHLADDQGWRVEIKSYPKLTEIGAWRVDHNIIDETLSNWWERPSQKPNEKPTYGGFYTHEDIKEIITYAKERYIEVIPEIDMPGHAQATIAAYPEIGCVNAAPYVATGGVWTNNTYNPGKEETFAFADKMLNELMDLFPFEYIHIGGDECSKEQWKIDPDAQKRIKEEGLKNEFELQSYFIKRIEKIINKRGRIMIGWDEILEGGLAPNATVMSWRGEAGGIKSAKEGHDVIMTPSEYCYIDLKQGHDDLEPNLGYSQLLLSKSYSYKVIPDNLSAEEGKHILGIQANMWTESISDWGKLTYMTFPRLYAIAESGWTEPNTKNWDDFTNRILNQFKRLDAQNVRYAKSAFSPWIDHEGNGESIEISMKTEVNGLDIYYTLDGLEPTPESILYQKPFTINKSIQLMAKSFKNKLAVGNVSTMEFPVHKGAGAKAFIYSDKEKGLPKLTDLSYGKMSMSDKNWQTIDGTSAIGLIFDTKTKITGLEFRTLRDTNSGVFPPELIEVYGSLDGMKFFELGSLDQKKISQINGTNKIESNLTFKETEVKELKIILNPINPIPGELRSSGKASTIRIDEIIVK